MRTIFQNTAVTKPLLSVKRLCEEGKAVLFLPGEYGASVIINLLTGEYEIEELREEDGNYMLDAWIPPASMQNGQEGQESSAAGFVRPR